MKTGKHDVVNKVFFSLVFVFMFFISSVTTPGINIHGGGSICADLLLATSIVTGVIYENRKAAGVIALVFGVVGDVFLNPPTSLSPLIYLLGAYYAPLIVGVFTGTNVLTVGIAAVPFLALKGVVGCIFASSYGNGVSIFRVIKNIALPELAFNIVAVAVIYVGVRFLYKHVKRRFYL